MPQKFHALKKVLVRNFWTESQIRKPENTFSTKIYKKFFFQKSLVKSLKNFFDQKLTRLGAQRASP